MTLKLLHHKTSSYFAIWSENDESNTNALLCHDDMVFLCSCVWIKVKHCLGILTQIPKCNVWRIELLTMPYSRVTSKSQPKREWVRTFEVGKPRKNENHMIYDVTSVLFPAGFPEAGTRLTTVKRFSQFQKLYNSLLQIHQVWYP